MGSPSDGAGGSTGGGNSGGGPAGSDNGGGAHESEESRSGGSNQTGMTGSERTAASDATRDQSFSESLSEAKAERDRNTSPNDDGGGSTGPSTTTPDGPDAPDTEDDVDGGGFFDSVGDFFGGVAKGMQDFARDNPRVDSHGNVVGLVDANGIQRGEVASRVMSSGTNPNDLAARLGFSSPQDMAAAQNTDFIADKFQEQKAADMVAAMEERYGPVPSDIQTMLADGQLSIVPANFDNPNMVDEMRAHAASVAFGDVEYTINNVNVVSAAETKLKQGDIDGYYREIDKIDPYGDLALDVRQQRTASGIIAEDYYRDTLRKEGFTDQQIDDFWATDTRTLAFTDLAARKAEFESYDVRNPDVYAVDGVLGEDQIATYHKDAMKDRFDNWTGKVPYETLGRWMATTPEARVTIANDMVSLARSGHPAAQAWVDEVIGDWDTAWASRGEFFSTLPDSLGLVGPALQGLFGLRESDYDDLNLAP